VDLLPVVRLHHKVADERWLARGNARYRHVIAICRCLGNNVLRNTVSACNKQRAYKQPHRPDFSPIKIKFNSGKENSNKLNLYYAIVQMPAYYIYFCIL